MKHAGKATLDRVEALLCELRRLRGIRERKRGIFYAKGSAFIHFHEDIPGVFADIHTGSKWLRLPVNRISERRRLVRLAKATLEN